VVVAVLNSEFSWLSVVIWLVGIWSSGTKWKPLQEGSDLRSFVMWVNWGGQMIVDSVVEGGELSSIWVIIDILSHLGIGSLVELVVLLVSDESGVGSIIDFVSGLSKLGDVVKSLLSLSIVNELVVWKVISPSNTVVKLSGGVIVVPLH
jgi:hypothetical protein